MLHAPEVGRGRPSKSSIPTPRLVMFAPAPIAGEVPWRCRSYGLTAETNNGFALTELVSHLGAAPAPYHRLFDHLAASGLPGILGVGPPTTYGKLEAC